MKKETEMISKKVLIDFIDNLLYSEYSRNESGVISTLILVKEFINEYKHSLTPTADEKEILKSICKEIDGVKHYGDLDERLIPGIEVVEEIIRLKGFDYLEHLKEEYTTPQEGPLNDGMHYSPTVDGNPPCAYCGNEKEDHIDSKLKCPDLKQEEQPEQIKSFRASLNNDIDNIIADEEQPEKSSFEQKIDDYIAEQKPVEWKEMLSPCQIEQSKVTMDLLRTTAIHDAINLNSMVLESAISNINSLNEMVIKQSNKIAELENRLKEKE